MDIRSLRYFLAAVDEGSISGAARRCRVAQPSVSQAIAKLEGELGGPLFDRSVKGIVPRPAGVDLARRARRILREIEEIPAAIEMDRGQQPILSLFIDPTIALGKLTPLLSELVAGADVRLVADRSGATVSIAPAVGDVSEIILWSERYVLCLPTDHPLAGQPTVRLPDLFGIRMIARCHCERSHLFPHETVSPQIVAEAAHEERVVSLVEAGIGAAIMPERDFSARDVAVCELADAQFSRTIALSGRARAVEMVRAAWEGRGGATAPPP